MASSFGGTVKLQGETEYRKALSQIQQNLREVSSEMKVVNSSYSANDNSIAKNTAQQQVLNKQLDTQQQKLDILKARYEELSKTEDVNSNSMSKLRTQINNAQTDVNNTTKSLNGLGNELNDTNKKTKSTGDGFTIFKGIVANLGTEAINGAINGLKSMGSALIDVGKQALESYSEYQQLTGGVETLFGDSAGAVEENAKKAFQTAGLSANEYMEQATSFSASLLQSLGGDTEKATSVADMAITDMADNANKMGTSIDSIQNAYQGFAKQNYTINLMSAMLVIA